MMRSPLPSCCYWSGKSRWWNRRGRARWRHHLLRLQRARFAVGEYAAGTNAELFPLTGAERLSGSGAGVFHRNALAEAAAIAAMARLSHCPLNALLQALPVRAAKKK